MTTRIAAATRRRSAGSAEDAPPVEVKLAAEAPAWIGTPAGEVEGDDVVDIWGHGSFPASDPPANW
jgi:hypothetical protein